MSLRALTMKASTRPLVMLGMRQTPIAARYMSTPAPQDPKEKASSILSALPGNSALSKTGILATSAAAAIYAISNELYVINDETILLATFSGFVAIAVKFLAPAYKDYADARVKQVSDVLNASRTKHVDAVKQRIDSVSELQSVSDTTKVLFDVSKETVELEAKAFELKQKVDLASEAKSVLDSWVRYEASVRQLQQQQLAETVIKKVTSELSNSKFQDKVLQQSVADVEKLFASLK
ncbi:LAQU0S16e02498g1_1 [Lachancea quebecensis]|uniref:ATP synthase subunit 4 n=1 Tax=Lachancea quebecensis TaxID=1654605 RepID=A0A0P1KWA2_9SACH|nr:LAQU0S16e02498g1_1 [Lachancea quebecensis]